MVGAFLSCIASIRAAVKFCSWAKSPWLRLALISTATFSSIYAFTYWWLLNHPDKLSELTEVMIVVHAFEWVVGPWLGFPLAVEINVKKRTKELRSKAAEVLEEVQLHEGGSSLS